MKGYANGRVSLTDPFALVDFDFSARRKRLLIALLLVALVSLIGLTAVVRSTAAPKLQRRLQADVERSLADDVNNLRVSVDGRSVRIAGDVTSANQRTRVIEQAQSRWGVRNLNADALKVK
jgi:BON domain